MKLSAAKPPAPNRGQSPRLQPIVWPQQVLGRGTGQFITFQSSPAEMWTLLRAHLVRSHRRSEGYWQFDFPFHTVVLAPARPEGTDALFRRILLGEVTVLRAHWRWDEALDLQANISRISDYQLPSSETSWPHVAQVRFLQVRFRSENQPD